MSRAQAKPQRWHAIAEDQSLQEMAQEIVLGCALQAIQQRGQFHLVLAGGDTPRELYTLLSQAKTDWSAWHIYFGDERCLPATDAERNSHMAALSWLDSVPIPTFQLHIIPAELGAQQATRLYGETLQAVGLFDLVLLGLGEDGHTASLFPGHDWGTVKGAPDTLAISDAPKPPAQRVSLSAARLSRTRKVLFMIKGESKHEAVTDWLAGKNIPALAIRPAAGVDILVESALLVPLGGVTSE